MTEQVNLFKLLFCCFAHRFSNKSDCDQIHVCGLGLSNFCVFGYYGQ